VTEALLFGRERELRVIEEQLDGVGEQGSALLIRGDAGVGKSSILRAAMGLARDRRMSVLSATGVESETNLPFTGLYELLQPILDRVEHLPAAHQNALLAAFGLAEGGTADLFLIALGALELLVDYGAQRALALVIDDVQWLDPSSTNVLAFIARRLRSEPIVLLIGSRDSADTSISDIVPELRIQGLDEVAATALLQAHNPELTVAIRDRVLSESAGVPLALVELPKALKSEMSVGELLPAHLPLTTRLERAFASRISDLPLSSRQLLLVAAISDGSSLAETLNATKLVGGDDVSLEALTPAVAAGLLTVNAADLHFRHPLVRSAIHGVSSIADRVAAHSALATILRDDPDRRAWHRAAATVGLDDAVAEELESAAVRALHRGDAYCAVRSLERAEQLSEDPARRARCLLQAAELAFEIGWPSVVAGLLQRAAVLELAPRDMVRLMWLREATGRSISGGRALTEIADSLQDQDDVDLTLDLLSGPATKGWWAEPDEQVCEHVIAAVERLRISSDDPRFLLILAMSAPIDRGAFVIDQLSRLSDFDADPRDARLLGLAAMLVGDFTLASRFLTNAVAGLRSEGRLALLAHVLAFRAFSALYLSDRNVAIADAAEAERLATETEQPIWLAVALGGSAMLAALHGEHDASEELASRSERATLPFGTLLAEVQMARGMNALGSGRYEDAYHHFHRLFVRTDSAYHPMKECFVIGDLAEAAVRSGHSDEAKAVLLEMEVLARRTPSPKFHSSMHHARAVLADDAEAERLFERALAADAGHSSFSQARIRLAYGSWLRRTRQPAAARPWLLSAMETFDALSASPWSERVRQELRAAGVTIQRRTPERREQLTPQELQIALMAAQGLSNREIGQKLYLSHRTVGSHLYRIFPKLEITSRYQLRDVLPSEGAILN
jgi:DNA-binding NarL/FixJ family response regulator